jgi:hypothetical protein
MDFGMADVRRFCRRLAARLGLEAPLSIEIALTLKMPQTADTALLRLFRCTSEAELAGNYFQVTLVSDDRDLVRRVREAMGGQPGEAMGTGMIRTWRKRNDWGGDEAVLERRLDARPPPSCPPQAVAPEWSARVDTEPRAAAAAQAQVCVGARPDLNQICYLAEGVPSVLSQLGLTSTSVRGIARLRRILGSAPSVGQPHLIGECAATDGLELHNPVLKDAKVPFAGVQAGEASVGIGAVHVPSLHATLRTRLPLGLLRAVRGQVHAWFGAEQGIVLDDEVLRSSSRTVAGGLRFRVDLAAEGNDLVALAADRDASLQPRVWWVVPERGRPPRPRDACRVVGQARRIPRQVPRVTTCVVSTGRGEVILESPLRDGEPVAVAASIGPGEVGLGKTGQFRVAVLAWRGPIGKGEVRCTAVQHVARRTLLAAGPAVSPRVLDDLSRLPLVVPFYPVT